ncbi:MAG: DNRLRE domain-containing protein [Prevotellaceae bacterium]|jgi:hypothetical protein|nr:DNRLRE domain-containing protein [Prevotellaceae bacterium]
MKRIFFTLLAVACASFAMAQPATIAVSEDTYVTGNAKNNDNDGDWSVVRGDEQHIITYYNDGYQTKKMGYLKFDLSSIASVDFNTVSSVKLKMYYDYMVETNGASQSVKVFNMNLVPNTDDFRDSWTEETLSFNLWKGDADVSQSGGAGLAANSGVGGTKNYYFRRNPDNLGANLNGSAAYLIAQYTVTDTEEGQWVEWDITNAVAANAGSNLVLQVNGATQVAAQDIAFRSKEYGDGTYAPYLEIAYEQPWNVTREAVTVADTYISYQAETSGCQAGRGAGDGIEPFGDDIEIVAMYNHAPTHSRRALLKFDIPYDPSLIDEARLYVYGKVTNGAAVDQPSKIYPGTAASATFHVYNMNYFMNNQTIFTPYVYNWDENIMYSDWTNGQTNASQMLLTEINPFYSRRNPDDNQSNNVAGQRYGVPGTEQGLFGQEQVELDTYKWYHFNLNLTAASSILNFVEEPLSLQICGYGADQNNPLEYIPFYIHSKENESGNVPYLKFKMKESNLLLSQIVAGVDEVDDFDPYITDYTVVIPSNLDIAPEVEGTLQVAGANVTYSQATATDGEATITVSDGTNSLTYTVTFSPTGDNTTPISANNNATDVLKVNVAGRDLNVVNANNTTLKVFDISGRMMYQATINGNFKYTFAQQGVYIVSAGNQIEKVIIK